MAACVALRSTRYSSTNRSRLGVMLSTALRVGATPSVIIREPAVRLQAWYRLVQASPSSFPSFHRHSIQEFARQLQTPVELGMLIRWHRVDDVGRVNRLV